MKETLRKAGKALLDADAAYANAADRRSMPLVSQIGHAMPLRDAVNFVKDPSVATGKGQPDTSIQGRALRGALNAGLVGANVASRYALPAGGITLAGAGILDLTAQFGSSADMPEQQSLTLQ
jgi:hypothetical protein